MGLADDIVASIIQQFREELDEVQRKLNVLLVIEERYLQQEKTFTRLFMRLEEMEKRERDRIGPSALTEDRVGRASGIWDKILLGIAGAIAGVAATYFSTHGGK